MTSHRGVLRFEIPSDPADRPARAHAGHEVRDPPGGLSPDLGPGGGLVRSRVLRIVVLVRLEGARRGRSDLVGDRVVGLRMLGRHRGRADHDPGPEGPQRVGASPRRSCRAW